MKNNDIDISNLPRRIFKGDRNAETELDNKFRERIFHIIKRKIPADDVQDLTQEVLIATLLQCRVQEVIDNLPGYIWTICKNKINDYYRKNKKEKFIGLEHITPLKNPDPDPPNIVEQDESLEIVIKLIQKLPDEKQQILVLYYYKELNCSEIGEILDMTGDNVRQTKKRIIDELKGKI